MTERFNTRNLQINRLKENRATGEQIREALTAYNGGRLFRSHATKN
jgi:hypothetical protein